jgi:hypothetical protein
MKSVTGIVKNLKSTLFLKKNLSEVKHENVSLEKKSGAVYIFTVTFNNDMLLQHQIDLFNKNMKDSFVFVVADNSSIPTKRELIADVCRNNKIPYISLPKNPVKDGSGSHAICLNWLYKNFVSIVKPDYFGFIDHDVFCIKPGSLKEILTRQPVYGCYQGREQYWYLWAGFCFFHYSELQDKKFDFSACEIGSINLDTGGANWKGIYSGIKKEDLIFPKQEYVTIRQGDSIQSSNVEVIDNWLHSFNGSYWLEMPEKENILFDFLQKYY